MRLQSLRTILLALLFVISASSLIHAQKRNKCPGYMWGIEYIPITYLGFKDAPAKISYTGWGNNEIDEKYPLEIGLRNLSNKNIKAIKFQWYLFKEKVWQNTWAEDWATFLEKITLMRDEISIDNTGEFKPEEEFKADIRLPCEKIFDEVGNVSIKERLIMEFVVSEISYSDGSNWMRKQ